MTSMETWEGQSAFAIYLRTGLRFRHQAGGEVEAKFNPWHDPDDGRFTFKGQGIYFAAGGEGSDQGGGRSAGRGRGGKGANGDVSARPGSAEARAKADDIAIRRRNEIYNPANPANHSIYSTKPGDTLTKIGASRQGLTAAGLARLNRIPENATLRIGQTIRVPNQAHLDAMRDAQGVVSGLSSYMDTHGGRLPSGAGKLTDQLASERTPVSKNGYTFGLDGLFRSRGMEGVLADEEGKRSPSNQRKAGGTDRRRTDDGGHYIAARFNGPIDSFNHFAQNANFNRGAYRVLEDSLAQVQKSGRKVFVRIVPYYHDISQRPYRISFGWRIDGKWYSKDFDNEKGGKKDE